MSLLTKLALLFIVLSILPLAIGGFIAYENSSNSLEQNTVNQLISTNILKESELGRWIGDSEIMLRSFSKRPDVREYSAVLVSADVHSAEYQQARDRIVQDHFSGILSEKKFTGLFILRGNDGKVLVSSDPDLEGRYRESEPYFLQGKIRTYVQNPYYSVGLTKVVMTIGTPVTDAQGNLIAVLAADLDLSEMSDIMDQRSGLSATEETYLVNKFNFFVTYPLRGQDMASGNSVHTTGVEAGLAHQDGVALYDNYAGVPVIGAYRWIPAREMCLVTEVSQAEAFEPVAALRNGMFIVGAIIAMLAAAGGVLLPAASLRRYRSWLKGPLK
jgi:hypothetical protein